MQRNLRLVSELLRVCQCFQANGIRAVSLKGPALSAALYGDPGLRTSADLDFLVDPADLISARDLLFREGFTMVSALHWQSDDAYRRSVNSEFTVSRQGISIDVHWRALPEYFPLALDSSSMIGRRGTLRLGGRDIPVLSPEDNLLYLAAHGAKHQWERLQWACDFARFVQTAPIDWSEAAARCDSAGDRVVLSHALALVRNLFQVPLPAQAERLIDERASLIARAAEDGVYRWRGQKSGVWESTKFLAQLTHSPAAWARLTHAVVFYPTEAEWSLVKLPSAAFHLYYPIRMVRLALKALGGIGAAR